VPRGKGGGLDDESRTTTDDDHRKLGIFYESGRAKRCGTGRPMLGRWRLSAITSETTTQ
jgi:hypothetical protein